MMDPIICFWNLGTDEIAKSQVLSLTLVIMDYIKYLCYYLNSVYTSFPQMSFNRCFYELASKIKKFYFKVVFSSL